MGAYNMVTSLFLLSMWLGVCPNDRRLFFALTEDAFIRPGLR